EQGDACAALFERLSCMLERRACRCDVVYDERVRMCRTAGIGDSECTRHILNALRAGEFRLLMSRFCANEQLRSKAGKRSVAEFSRQSIENDLYLIKSSVALAAFVQRYGYEQDLPRREL